MPLNELRNQKILLKKIVVLRGIGRMIQLGSMESMDFYKVAEGTQGKNGTHEMSTI